MKTYIVISHYIVSDEVAQLAKDTILSFRKTKPDGIIISVDDVSPKHDPEIEVLSDVFIQREENGGFAKCVNTGFDWILKNDKEECWVVYANNDIEVYDGWFEEFEKCFNQFNAGMVGGLGYRSKEILGTPLSKWKPEYNYYSEGGRLNDWMFPGGFFMTTRKFLRDVGVYDEAYEHGGIEDIDLFYRAKLKGYRLIMTPFVSYWHQEGATRYHPSQIGKQRECITKNEMYFKRKWGFHPIANLNSKILLDNRINP